MSDAKFTKKVIKKNDLKALIGRPIIPEFNLAKKPVLGTVNILGVNGFGGICLPLEAIIVPGNNNTFKTGCLGKLLKESIAVATNYLKSNAKELSINHSFKEEDIHVNILSKGNPWEGGSAGAAITTAVYSILTNTEIEPSLAMTGEISLYGHILPVGKIKEKAIAAANAGIKTILLPLGNKTDLDDIPKEVIDSLDIRFIEHFNDVITYLNKP